MLVIGTLPFQTYDYDRYLAAAQAREAHRRDQLQRQLLLDNLLAQHAAGYDGGWSCPPSARGCSRYSPSCTYGVANTNPHLGQWMYEDLAERRERERQEAIDRALREREARMKAWKQYIQQQQARRSESATSQTVRTSDLDDCIASIKLFPLVQNPGPSSSQQPGFEATTSASQPTTIAIDVPDVKGKSISPSETESDFDTADPGAIQTSLSTLEELGASLTKLENDFVFPDELDFESSSSTNDSELKLAYSSRNAPLRYYDHALQDLLSNLDAVPSYGSAAVRDARRAIVMRVEKMLEKLEEQIEEKKGVALWKMKKAASEAGLVTDVLDARTETTLDDAHEMLESQPETSDIGEGNAVADTEIKTAHPEMPDASADDVEVVEEAKPDVEVVAEDPSESVFPELPQATLEVDGDADIAGVELGQAAMTMNEEATLSSPTTIPLPFPDSPRPHTDALPESHHEVDSLLVSRPEEPAATISELTSTPAPESLLVDPAMSTDTAEEEDIDTFLLAQSPSPPPTPLDSEAEEDAVLVDVHEEEDMWVDVEA